MGKNDAVIDLGALRTTSHSIPTTPTDLEKRISMTS
jgi:hypothetical protein